MEEGNEDMHQREERCSRTLKEFSASAAPLRELLEQSHPQGGAKSFLLEVQGAVAPLRNFSRTATLVEEEKKGTHQREEMCSHTLKEFSASAALLRELLEQPHH